MDLIVSKCDKFIKIRPCIPDIGQKVPPKIPKCLTINGLAVTLDLLTLKANQFIYTVFHKQGSAYICS